MKQESGAMRFFKAMGMESVAWSLRRLHCPVGKDALVLDVGAGGNPYPRANVLIDGYEDTIERYHAPLVKDRPMVLGMVEHLPFKDKSFDFVIASHVLEHIANPEIFLNELMRVGKSGYIETPDAFFERINPWRFHRLEVTDVGSKIRIMKKPSWRHSAEVVDLFERKVKDKQFLRYLAKHPEPFYMRYYWMDEIDYEIVNPEIDAAWQLPSTGGRQPEMSGGLGSRVRKCITKTLRYLLSQSKRNRQIDLFNLLMCPTCGNETLSRGDGSLTCCKCHNTYPITDGIPHMFPNNKAL